MHCFCMFYAALWLKMQSKMLPPFADYSLSAKGGSIFCLISLNGTRIKRGRKAGSVCAQLKI